MFKPYGWNGKEYIASGSDNEGKWHSATDTTPKTAKRHLEGIVSGPVEISVSGLV
ncbi:hypothetical protein JXA85_08120 [Candidatus Woesearchaeota archaeon]|nr:hypothetical protein [Candidatus Woesearchaeota archaeon]